MLSKNKAKFIKSLRLKKFREESGCFAVEGSKSVLELIASDFEVQALACTESFRREHGPALKGKKFETIVCSPAELGAVSAFETNESALAVARMRTTRLPEPLHGPALALDGVRDPGNLGAIVRTADWYGISRILVSEDTTDFYNPKALQASMGSFCRVNAHYGNLESELARARLPVYAAGKGGKSVHDFAFRKDCILLLGNESRGISPALAKLVAAPIGIPGYGRAESLNVAAAAAVICDNYRRLTA